MAAAEFGYSYDVALSEVAELLDNAGMRLAVEEPLGIFHQVAKLEEQRGVLGPQVVGSPAEEGGHLDGVLEIAEGLLEGKVRGQPVAQAGEQVDELPRGSAGGSGQGEHARSFLE